jgi:hypothetical protein
VVEQTTNHKPEKNLAAVAHGTEGWLDLKGGKARAELPSATRRREIVKKSRDLPVAVKIWLKKTLAFNYWLSIIQLTKHMDSQFFLTEVGQDWPSQNLIVLQDVIFEANQAVLDRTNPVEDPLLDNPLLPHLKGYLRWILLQKLLEQAVANGRFTGITAQWSDLGGVSVLELKGAFTRVTPYYLIAPDEVPRESTYRRSTRVENQVYQSLPGFEQADADERLVNLLLVHGGRYETFAYLRAYCDRLNRANHIQLSNNIMLMPALLESLGFEQIEDPEIELNNEAQDDEDASEGEQ